MAVQHTSYTVGTTPQAIATVPGGGRRKIYVENRSTTVAINVGDATITNANGFQLTAQASTGVSHRLEIELFGGDVLYACATSGTATISILTPGI